MNGRTSGGHESHHFPHSFVAQLTDPAGSLGIKSLEPLFHLLISLDPPEDIIPVHPALLQQDLYHAFQHQCIRAGPDGQVYVCYPGCFTEARIHHHEGSMGVLGHGGQKPPGLGHLMTLHAVPAQSHQDFGVIMVRNSK